MDQSVYGKEHAQTRQTYLATFWYAVQPPEPSEKVMTTTHYLRKWILGLSYKINRYMNCKNNELTLILLPSFKYAGY
jgi:hypothetical protein